MGLKEDLESEVSNTFKYQWSRRDGRVIPHTRDVGLSNDAVDLDVTILYADIDKSTDLVDTKKDEFAAEHYKAFLRCCAKLIRGQDGEVRSFDGDRVMGIFIGTRKNSRAVKAALQINWAVLDIIRPIAKEVYGTGYALRHSVGIDTSKVMAIRAGIRGTDNNDLSWIGKSANYAAKLNSSELPYATLITKGVYDVLEDASKFADKEKTKNMWVEASWGGLPHVRLYGSTYYWAA